MLPPCVVGPTVPAGPVGAAILAAGARVDVTALAATTAGAVQEIVKFDGQVMTTVPPGLAGLVALTPSPFKVGSALIAVARACAAVVAETGFVRTAVVTGSLAPP